jgi:hypothetical protein
MHWHFQPLLWPFIIGTLALLAVPHSAHPQQPSPALRAACDADARKLCPLEYALPHGPRREAAVGLCMKQRAGLLNTSLACKAAWIKEQALPRTPKK